MATQTATTTSTAPAKFSRYRSVRRATTLTPPEEPPALPEPRSSLTRVPSRYHRARAGTQRSEEQPELPKSNNSFGQQSPPSTGYTIPEQREPRSLSQQAQTSPPKRYRHTAHGRRRQDDLNDEPSSPEQECGTPRTRTEQNVVQSVTDGALPIMANEARYEAAREEARMILEGEYDRIQKLKVVQKKGARDLRNQAPNLNARPRRPTVTEPRVPDIDDAKTRHNLAKFRDAPKLQKKQAVHDNTFIPAPQNMVDQAPKMTTQSESKAPAPVIAQFDAPVSAVNAGERRVEIRANGAKSGVTLPVNPTTTVKDLINSASVVMSESIDPRLSVLVESFFQLELERPLRRYEHVRDVMNSWDYDSQNHLVIMSEQECTAIGLDRKDAPTMQPDDVELQMYVSQRPGKWEKRFIVLRSDGQVTMSKHANDGEAQNICHISDFDVYVPTRKQIKKLKPPKKICFAIKSQQKSAMFLERVNFVHYFATNDKQVADRWYNAVQAWRSWYLADVLGECNQNNQAAQAGVPGVVAEERPPTSQSAETIPYQLGSFKPLLDFDDVHFGDSFDSTNGASGNRISHARLPSDHNRGRSSTDHRGSSDVSRESPKRGSRQQRRGPPPAFSTKLLAEARNRVDVATENTEQAFTGTGLLARSMSRRSQGGKPSGHGISGTKGKPLVDLSEHHEFADGSLLQQLQAWSATQGDLEPKIDRQRRLEADIRVGEGT